MSVLFRRYALIGSVWGFRMSRWIPPQRVQRSVQYSDWAFPPKTRITARLPWHSGQFDRTVLVACDRAPLWGMAVPPSCS
jgi:hypothetical protein